ncbi:MAG: pseudouridine synthase [Planctomycetaceae bacterium]|nr:pseudouridine synthase [Planctomycetaceae bacterium]
MPAQTYHLAAQHNGLSLPQVLKRLLPEPSWSEIRKLIAGRQVQVNGNLCLDEGRRVKTGDVLKLWDHPLAKPADASDVKIVHLDEHLIVVQKPAGVTTLRHRDQTDLPSRRKQLQPTLDELVVQVLAERLGIDTIPTRQRGRDRRSGKIRRDPRLTIRPVHRLDRDTSGLMVFARTTAAEHKLIRMFAQHEVERAYVAVAHGQVEAQTIDNWLVRDRGDGLRGSSPLGEAPEGAQRAITHLRPMEHLPGYTILECRLETGRTHQIRIHLAERGHMLCGEKTYTHPPGGKPREDASGAPRQALHAAELAFIHPITAQPLRFQMPLPKDLRQWLLKLRAAGQAT